MKRWILQRRVAAKAARRVCRRFKGRGGKGVMITVLDNPDWHSERAAVDEILREEQRKRGLR